jgi:putative FmdB family regulatory protein
MPIYEYSCDACGHELEALQSVSDDPLAECPECGKPKLRKLISAAAFRLKGSGWYETDFKKGKQRNLAGDGGKSSESPGKSPAASSSDSAGGKSDKPAKSAKSGDGKSKTAAGS